MKHQRFTSEIVVWLFWWIAVATVRIECREPLKPETDVGDVINDADNSYPQYNEGGGGACLLDVQKDLAPPKQPQPLYLVPNTSEVWPPNARGQLEVPHGAAIELFCTHELVVAGGAEQEAPPLAPATKSLLLRCLQGRTFAAAGGAKWRLAQLSCSRPPWFSVEPLEQRCAGDAARLYRVGFHVGDRFLETLRVCYDTDALRALYAVHRLHPASVHFQRSVRRLSFSAAGQLPQHDLGAMYSRRNQEQLLGGRPAQDARYLSRGHLVAKADQVYENQQRSTFVFFNAAPQWQSFNAGQWAAMETQVREFVARARLQVECYTGTWGVQEVRGADGVPHAFYLGRDANHNGLLPVPQLFYRVVLDRAQPGRGLVLVGVNGPVADGGDVCDALTLCEDVRERVAWLRWMRNRDPAKGYMYACRVDEFARAVGHLPAHLAHVQELLLGD